MVEADGTCALTVAGQEHKNVWYAVAFGLDNRGRKQGSHRAFITEKRYTASAVDMEDFGQRLKGLIHRTGVRTARQAAFIGDVFVEMGATDDAAGDGVHSGFLARL